MTFDNYIQSLPSIEMDNESWKNCGPCAQGDSKVPYCECGECKHLNSNLVRQYIAHEESLWEDLDLEMTDYNNSGSYDDDHIECEKNYLDEWRDTYESSRQRDTILNGCIGDNYQ